MFLRSLLTLSLLIGFTFSAQARKPAVEDFVGVESEHYKKTPKGTEVLFNFGNQIQSVTNKTDINAQGLAQSSWFGLFALASFASLPFLMWFGIVGLNKNNKNLEEALSELSTSIEETAAPVANLEDYRKTDSDDDVKKAS